MTKRVGWILVLAAASGAATLVLELSAVRLLAPWFGATSGVWTHVIGVILLALAAGYLLGARLARGEQPVRALARILWCAAALTCCVPALAAPVSRWFVPEGLALDQAAGILRWGSLAAALLLFAPPTFVLGCVAPLTSELHQRASGCHAGESGGRILCVSTLGSLAGSFATTYVFIPELGLTRTYFAVGLLLAAIAALASLRARRAGAELAAGLVVLAALLATPAGGPTPRPGERLLEQGESAYQSVRVVERTAPSLRLLQVNEGFDSFQSVWQEAPGLLPEGFYYNAFALPAAWEARERGTWRVLILGLGAGTAWRVLEGTLPAGVELAGDGVEIDPLVVRLGRRWMDLGGHPGLRIHSGSDARAVLRSLGGEYDQVIVDAYANQVEIPPHLSTREFFREVAARLRPGGWLSLNVGGFGLDDPVVAALADTSSEALEGEVLLLRVPLSRNLALVLRKQGPLPEPGSPGFTSLAPPGLGRLASQMSLPGVWRRQSPARGPVLNDDRNPIERLQQRSLDLAALRRGPGGGS